MSARKIILLALGATVAVGLSLGPATAQPKARTPVAPVYNWTGFYIGAALGGGWQEIDGRFTTSPFSPHGTSATRFWGGAHVGYQVMFPNRWVVGIEGSYSTPWDNAYATATTGPECLTFTANRTCGSRILNVWTVGAKVGHAFGNWMVYGAGGYANARIDAFASTTSTGSWFFGTGERHHGWDAGAGVDVMVTRVMQSDLILGIEYRHMEFSERLHPYPSPFEDRNHSATAGTIMAKATFKWAGR